MRTLEIGESYLIKTHHGHFYLGEFAGCKKQKYMGSKALRTVEVFKDSYDKSYAGNLNHYSYLHLISHKMVGAIKVEFDKAKFLNMSKPDMELCFNGGV